MTIASRTFENVFRYLGFKVFIGVYRTTQMNNYMSSILYELQEAVSFRLSPHAFHNSLLPKKMCANFFSEGLRIFFSLFFSRSPMCPSVGGNRTWTKRGSWLPSMQVFTTNQITLHVTLCKLNPNIVWKSQEKSCASCCLWSPFENLGYERIWTYFCWQGHCSQWVLSSINCQMLSLLSLPSQF